jgi:sialic acid synthase SpsE/quercetin dioxygenase-like cupin family protein
MERRLRVAIPRRYNAVAINRLSTTGLVEGDDGVIRAVSGVNQRPLFILEMANNHMGSLAHGLKIIDAMREVVQDFPFQFGIKLQYRDIESFVHPAYRTRHDLKFVKRFSETQLPWEQYRALKNAIVEAGFVSVCTPWDEASVDRIEEHEYDIIKVASCYFTDWPLLERIALAKKPVIASVAGVRLENIDRVVAFFLHRKMRFALMHCVGEYPTPDENLQLGQIALLRGRYGEVEVGYSTHERPDNYDSVKIAIGLGVRLFEKHVGVETEAIRLNKYSANPSQLRCWLEAASAALQMCGESQERCRFTSEELATLKDLQRGVFARQDLPAGARLTLENTFLAIPGTSAQLRANDLSKYVDFTLTQPLPALAAATAANTRFCDRRHHVPQIAGAVKRLLKQARVAVPGGIELEISHHYGMEKFRQFGSAVLTVVNREYCKRIIVLLPGQAHPEQYHKCKDETYHILYGELELSLDGAPRRVSANDVVVIPRGVRHSFSTKKGVIIEEVSSRYSQGDSYYTDPTIEANEARKTFVMYWMD